VTQIPTGAVLLSVACLLVGGCSATSDPATTATEPPDPAVSFDQALHDELVEMQEGDQRGGGSDAARVQRLEEIIDEHGWPTHDLVGRDGGEAAWLIAQHADLHPEFQERALGLLRRAVEDGQASPGNLAYLDDRVAVANGQPQMYGTQIQCTANGPEPSTPLVDRARIDKRRAEAGLDPLDAYIEEMTEICSGG
jgi:hypothetical protein